MIQYVCVYVCISLKYSLIIDISMPPLDHEMGLVSHSQTLQFGLVNKTLGSFNKKKRPLEVCLAHNTTATHKLKLQLQAVQIPKHKL